MRVYVPLSGGRKRRRKVRTEKQKGIIALAVIALIVAVAINAAFRTPHHSETINRATYTGTWPLTVDTATLQCDSRNRVVVTIGATSYLLTGVPDGTYADPAPITAPDPAMAGVPLSLNDLVVEGEKLC